MKFESGELNIICTDLEASLYFYKDILGFEFVKDDEGAVRLKNGDSAYLLLPFAQGRQPASPYCSLAMLSFDLLVPDLGSAFEYLKQKQVKFETEWQEGKPSFVIKDPDGLFIEVIGRS